MATLPICGWHHRADVRGCQALCNPPTISNATKVYGPSFEDSKSEFTKRYGTESELLEQINRQLQADDAA
jgi:hypothetical protein